MISYTVFQAHKHELFSLSLNLFLFSIIKYLLINMFDKIKIRFILAKLIEYKIINKRPLLKKNWLTVIFKDYHRDCIEECFEKTRDPRCPKCRRTPSDISSLTSQSCPTSFSAPVEPSVKRGNKYSRLLEIEFQIV